MSKIQIEYIFIVLFFVAGGLAVAKIQNLYACIICIFLAGFWLALSKIKKFDDHSVLIGLAGLIIAAIGKFIALQNL